MKKLNSKGLSHDLVLVAFVVIFAISGVAYMVASKAATCNSADPWSKCGPVSQVVSTAKSGAAATCSVTNSSKTRIKPAITIQNSGMKSIKPTVTVNTSVNANGTTIQSGKDYTFRTIKSGQGIKKNLPAIKSLPGQTVVINVYSKSPSLACAGTFTEYDPATRKLR